MALILAVRARTRAEVRALRVAAAFHAAETQYRDLIAATAEGLWEMDASGRTVAVNPALCQLLGYAREEMIGLGPEEFVEAPEAEKLRTVLGAPGTPPDAATPWIELLLWNRDRRPVPVRARAMPLAGGDRRQAGTLLLVQDLSAERHCQQELIATQEHLVEILGAVPVAVLILRPTDGAILYLNDRGAQLLGLSQEETQAHRIREFYERTQDHDRFLETVVRDGAISQFEARMRSADGRTWWALLSGRFLRFDEREAILVGAQDISRRVESEAAIQREKERAERYLAVAGTLIVVLDREARITLINRKGCAVFGRTAEELVGRDWITLAIPEEERDAIRSVHVRLMAGQEMGVATFENDILIGNGERRHFVWHNTFIQDDDGTVIGTLSSGEDVTDRLRAEAEIVRSNAELEQFSYIVSHDLQEPLRTISSYMTLLRTYHADKLDPEAAEFMDFAHQSAARMRTMIKDLLEYSRIQRVQIPRDSTDLGLVVEEALANLKGAIDDSGAVFSIAPLPVVQGDRAQLLRLFQNLIGNALKFRDRDRIVRVGIGAEPAAGNQWGLFVSDNGIGIDAKYGERIFQVFQRLHGHERYEGTGIGLAVCRRIVERHGGRIWVESEVDVGSTFRFTLPKASTSTDPVVR
ncbi:MAG: PAS domain S-box protein [Alphaproteobacteria bacterium]